MLGSVVISESNGQGHRTHQGPTGMGTEECLYYTK